MKNILKKGVEFIPIVVTFLAGLVAWLKNRKAKKLKTKNNSMSSYEDMYNKMLGYITEAERLGNLFKTALGDNTGEWKLSNVLKELKLYALTMKYDFDETYWTNEINSTVKFTKYVNCNVEKSTIMENKKEELIKR